MEIVSGGFLRYERGEDEESELMAVELLVVNLSLPFSGYQACFHDNLCDISFNFPAFNAMKYLWITRSRPFRASMRMLVETDVALATK
jgi:hypothetical protein